MIGIVDYGMGNLLSVFHAVEMAGADALICHHPEQLAEVERIILPGVGAFPDCMASLRSLGFIEALQDAVMLLGRPILGICLGMQAMARRGFEGGECAGLGWLDADVVRLEPSDAALRVPHVGWNDVRWTHGSPLFQGLPEAAHFYFVHSYAMRCRDSGLVDATCDYGGETTAAVRLDNIFATQFHPEKSQDYGLRILENFLKWNP